MEPDDLADLARRVCEVAEAGGEEQIDAVDAEFIRAAERLLESRGDTE